MATGDDALAAGMTLVTGTEPSNTLDTIINGVMDEIARRTSAVMPVGKGGTGSTTAAGARTALGITSENIPDQGSTVRAHIQFLADDKAPKSDTFRKDETYNQGTIDSAFSSRDNNINHLAGRIDGKRDQSNGHFDGDLSAANLYLRNSYAASGGWTTAYINSDGRVAKGASSERFKKYISAIDPEELGDIFPDFQRFQMRSMNGSPSDGEWKYGYIAERLAEYPDTLPFVVFEWAQDEDGKWAPTDVPESIDFISLLMAQVAQLHQRNTALEARLTALEN